MKQTAVEWLVEQMKKYNMTVSVHNTSHQNVMDFYKAIEQAKEMEREQKNDLPVHFHEGVSNIWVFIEDGIIHVMPSPEKPLNQNRMKKILCWLGWHNFTCSIQDLIDEFGYIPLDNKMASNSKCERCGKTFKSG